MTSPISAATGAATATAATGTAKTTAGAAAKPAASADSAEGQKMFTNADFSTFLKMLTTQMKNQDPLNPMEGTEFAVQLATFSGVEQQAYTNKLLTQLATQMSGGGLSEAADWIGKEARTTAPVHFTTSPVTLTVEPDATADSVILVTKDRYGREVLREEIGPGAGEVDWFGRDKGGNKLPDGDYSFSIESWKKENKLSEGKVASYALVAGVESTPEGPELQFARGGSVLMTQVDGLRQPR